MMNIFAQSTTQPAESVWQSLRDAIHSTIHHTTWGGWVGLLLGIFAGYVAGYVARKILDSLADRLQRHNQTIRATALRSAATPASLLLLTLGVSIGLGAVAMSTEILWFVGRVLALAYIVGFGWLLFNLIDVVDLTLKRFAARTTSNLDDQMVPLVRKALRLFLVIVLALFTLENVFDRDVSTWLAGLGIIGLAVSFAAQDSIKNFFGSITILLDRPFQLKERVIIDGHDGVIEDIGFRSTRIRKMDGVLVTIPNSKIVEQSVQNITRRPTLRRVVDISITYDTSRKKIERAIDILNEILTQPEFVDMFDMDSLPPRIHFTEMKADTLNIEVMYWYKDSANIWGFKALAQKFNLQVIERFGDDDIELAFPTQTIYVKNSDQVTLPQPQSDANK